MGCSFLSHHTIKLSWRLENVPRIVAGSWLSLMEIWQSLVMQHYDLTLVFVFLFVQIKWYQPGRVWDSRWTFGELMSLQSYSTQCYVISSMSRNFWVTSPINVMRLVRFQRIISRQPNRCLRKSMAFKAYCRFAYASRTWENNCEAQLCPK